MKKSSKKLNEVQLGLVIAYFGKQVAVEANGQLFQCHLKRNQPLPVVGDSVSFEPVSEDTAIVTKIHPRFSQLLRGEERGVQKVLAANIHTLAIVMAPFPTFSTYLIDRYLLAAELLNISAMIILNKTDLLADHQVTTKELITIYRDLSYPIVYTSVYQQHGLHELAQHLVNKTTVLMGPSGVGKSSIISTLKKDDSIKIGEVSNKGIGKHTTTASRLYHLSEGGDVIDSPGIRDFNLWKLKEKDVLQGFREFNRIEGVCRFKNCRHLVEPGCRILQAQEEGLIHPKRFESYILLMNEAKL